ncbi:MAG: hypothetical protein IKH21_03500 [Clostridia bacterium]|nr:hypothetical protein [Clostridia bacterium]
MEEHFSASNCLGNSSGYRFRRTQMDGAWRDRRLNTAIDIFEGGIIPFQMQKNAECKDKQYREGSVDMRNSARIIALLMAAFFVLSAVVAVVTVFVR